MNSVHNKRPVPFQSAKNVHNNWTVHHSICSVGLIPHKCFVPFVQFPRNLNECTPLQYPDHIHVSHDRIRLGKMQAHSKFLLMWNHVCHSISCEIWLELKFIVFGYGIMSNHTIINLRISDFLDFIIVFRLAYDNRRKICIPITIWSFDDKTYCLQLEEITRKQLSPFYSSARIV